MYHMKGKFLSTTLAATLAVFLCLGISLLQARAETPQSNRDDSESLRKALHELLPMFKTCASCTGEDNEDQIAKLEQKLDGLSKEEMASVARVFDVPRFITLVEKLKAETATSGGESVASPPLKSSIAPPSYEFGCSPPRRPSAMTLLGFILVISTMEEAENSSAIICETGASIPLEGIATPACVASLFIESVAIIGRTTLTAFLNCIASIDSAEIQASWRNTVNIHDDLTTFSEMISQRFQALEQNVNDINSQLQKTLAIMRTKQGKGQGVSCGD
jgi:hypothetical protein